MEPETDRLTYEMARTEHALRHILDTRLRPFGVSLLGWAVLRQIVREPGISGAELTRRVFVSQQAVSKLLARLERLDLVRHADRPGRVRVQDYASTLRGQQIAETCDTLVAQIEDSLRTHLGEKNALELLETLRACREILERDH